MRQLVDTMLITNNRASFHLRGKKNLVKHQKVSKYYENDGPQNFLLLLCLYQQLQLLKTVILRLESLSIQTFGLSEKIGKAVSSKSIFITFLELICSNFRLNLCEEIVNEIKFEGVWGELEAKNCFQKQSFSKYLRQTLVFM